ncbi:MAG: ATP-binding domain-containing protein [Gammaproteobacteria bacterium]
MTVHKAYGSELDRIALVLPPRGSAVVTRELLYTAVTRARQSVEIWATETALRTAIERRIRRASGLASRL